MAAPAGIARRNGPPPKVDPAVERAVANLSSTRGVRDCLAWLHRNRHWINEQQLEVCRVPAPTFLEEKRAAWMCDQLRRLGWDAKVDRAGNVVALEPGWREGPLVALTAHLDTVIAPRRNEDIRIDGDGRFRGPGVADNGAGLAGLLAVAGVWMEARPVVSNGAGLLLVANVCEEGEGNLSGMRYLCRQSPLAPRIRSFLVLDGPSTGHITCQALASRRFEITMSGPGGHSWSDHGNGNAVHALSRAIHYFSESQYHATDSSLIRTAFNFGMVEGGVSVNSIPSVARAKLDIRSEDAYLMEEMTQRLYVAVERAMEMENSRATGGRVQAKVKEIGSRPGGSLPEDSPLLRVLRSVDAHLGIRAHLDCASTDANIPLSMGMEALSIGAGGQGAGAHTADEWFDPSRREVGLHRIVLTLCMLLEAASA
jgi:acetylornithine deacetylase/succinyl-diaminopimelate desuccinylase-like protein